MACGFSHTIVVTLEGRLFSWGYNEFGELGHGDIFTGLRKPRQIVHFRSMCDGPSDEAGAKRSENSGAPARKIAIFSHCIREPRSEPEQYPAAAMSRRLKTNAHPSQSAGQGI